MLMLVTDIRGTPGRKVVEAKKKKHGEQDSDHHHPHRKS